MSADGAAGFEALARIGYWFLRHGETDWNAAGLGQGSTDIPLNDVGRAQAAVAASLLVGRGVAAIVASPLSRALETARIVAAVLRVPVSTDAELREAAFGVEEGMPMGDWYETWIAGGPPPKGGESFDYLRDRAVRAANRALAGPSPVLIVAHGSLFRGLRAAMGLAVTVRTPNAVPLYCRPGEGSWALEVVREEGRQAVLF